MEIKYHKSANKHVVAELTDINFIISRTQDILDVFGDLMASGCDRIIIHEKNLHPGFFDLKTGLAGDILQKFSNFQIKLAVIGDFSKFRSKSLGDFIYESNKSGSVYFTSNIDSALLSLQK